MPTSDSAATIILASPDLLWQPIVLIVSGLAVMLASLYRQRHWPAIAGLVACECGAWLDDDLTMAVGAAVVMVAIWLTRMKDSKK